MLFMRIVLVGLPVLIDKIDCDQMRLNNKSVDDVYKY